MKKIRIRQITMIGIMAAAVYMASAFLQISIPTAIGKIPAFSRSRGGSIQLCAVVYRKKFY